MLEGADHNGTSHVVSWQPHGRSFRVHYPKDFIEHIMPKVFRQSKWSSFQRQLNLYGFMRITDGPDKGAYYHPKFLRGMPAKSAQIVRTRIKGTKVRTATHPDDNPNFYEMPPLEPSKPKTTSSILQSTTLNNTNIAAALIAQAHQQQQQQQMTLQQAFDLQNAWQSTPASSSPVLHNITMESLFEQQLPQKDDIVIVADDSCSSMPLDLTVSQNEFDNDNSNHVITPDEQQQQQQRTSQQSDDDDDDDNVQKLDDEVYDLLQSMFPKKRSNSMMLATPSHVPSDKDDMLSLSSLVTSMDSSSSLFEPNDVGDLPNTDQRWGQLLEQIFEV